MLLRRSGSVAHETTNQSRRDAENAHTMALDERPQAIRPRKIQCPFVKHHRGAEKSCAENFPRSHHPSHIRYPVKNVLASNVESVDHVLRRFDGKTAVGVESALRPSGRSGGINNHQGILSVGPLRFRVVGLAINLLMPPPVTAGRPRNRRPKPLKNEHVLHGWGGIRGFIGNRFQQHALSPTIEAIDG